MSGSRGFHPLGVAAIEPLTEDSVTITFEIPTDLRRIFAFRPGQHLTVLGPDGGRRSYSLCDAPEVGRVRIGVKILPGGAFSEEVVGKLVVEDTLEVMPPSGHFCPDEAVVDGPSRGRHVVAVAAGSGITPIRSILESVLSADDDTTATLIYANRTQRSAMFLDEIHDLKDRFTTRFQIIHVLSREPREVELFSGRLDGARLRRIIEATVDVAAVDEWFLCGPQAMVVEHRSVIEQYDATGRVHVELFHADPSLRSSPVAVGPGADASVLIRLDGRESSVALAHSAETILEAAQRVRSDVPFACRGGVCGTCRAQVVEGAVEMDASWALEDDEIAAGYVLTCQSHPTSARVVLDYDA